MKQLCKKCGKPAEVKISFSDIEGIKYDPNNIYNNKYYNDKFGGYFCTEHDPDKEYKG